MGTVTIKAMQAAYRDKASAPAPCEHDWVLTEDGYNRTWNTEIITDDDGVETVIATESDYSGDGDGEYLLCGDCGVTREAPKIRWR